MRDKLIWGVFLTFFIKSFLKLYVASVQGVEDTEKTQLERMGPFVILLVMSAGAMFMLTGIVNMREKLDNEIVIRRYGALTLNLKTDSPPGYLFNWIFVMRRLIYGLSIGYLTANPAFQTFI